MKTWKMTRGPKVACQRWPCKLEACRSEVMSVINLPRRTIELCCSPLSNCIQEFSVATSNTTPFPSAMRARPLIDSTLSSGKNLLNTPYAKDGVQIGFPASRSRVTWCSRVVRSDLLFISV
ncbi:hypothetical protein PVL29_000232 [Vitis rotundifolia]|uniref:Uncharacterized protein n=1 Tax=Vitis rotundifolia TaxID=103349 RepID=A0AA39E3E1_VITRO|nr:hypothetical protein PVL29_000232 [Vitis rotundifolia]